jgi:SPP1 gp7 family putative phage head morphogenesis protein
MLAAVKLSYRTALVDILSQYRQALVTALLHYGGWDPRAVAVEGHYLLVLHGLVGHAFDQMWPKLVKAIEEQAKAQGLPVVIPEKETWKQSSVVLMEKSARELGTDMRRGGREDDIGVGRASVIAENEIGRMAASANEAAQRAAGVTSFVWSGMMDDRERPEHVALEGRVFSWDTDHYKPGEQVNCRCWPVAVTHLRA